jgi:hypothetical protein
MKFQDEMECITFFINIYKLEKKKIGLARSKDSNLDEPES